MNRTTFTVLATTSVALVVPVAASATMAYVTTPTNIRVQSRVMVANDDGSGARPLARGSWAGISPDGTKVAYLANWSSTASGSGFTASIVELATGATTSLGTACNAPLTWAPNSMMIACQTQSASRRPPGYVTGNGLGIVQVPASLVGVSTLPVTNYIAARGNAVDPTVAFSPDSASIAFATRPFSDSAGFTTLYVAPLANAAARTRVLARAVGPVWGTPGIVAQQQRWVRWQGTRTVRGQLWIVQPDGTGATRLTNYRATGLTDGPFATAWAPSGALLAGVVGGEDQSDLSTISASTGAVRVLRKGYINTPVAFSADSRRILFSTGSDGGPMSIRIIGVNGRGQRTLVKNAGTPSVSAGWNG